MATSRTVQAGPVELAVLEAGAGGRPFLLVHGFTGAKEDFEDHLDALGDAGWHVVAPDNRGHGSSTKPTEESAYSLATYAGDCFALADALGWDRFVLLGHSMGGMIVQVMALQAPERLEALILMDTTHKGIAVDRELALGGVELVREQGIDGLADLMAAQTDGGPLESPAARRLRETRPGWVERGDAQLRRASAGMYAAMLTEMLDQADRLEGLRSLDVPTLVIVGEQDKPFLNASRRMAEAIPGARLAVIPDAGHSPQFENPEPWAKELVGFLEVVR